MIVPQFVPLLEINIHILIYDQCLPCVLRSDPNMLERSVYNHMMTIIIILKKCGAMVN